MQVVIATVAIFGLAVGGMALGVIFSNRPLKGSCGGTGGQDCFCDANGLPRECEKKDRGEQLVAVRVGK